MKKLLLVIIAMAAVYYTLDQPGSVVDQIAAQSPSAAPRVQNDNQWRAGQQVSGSGTVERILSDDNRGSRHQRFILRLGSGRTLLVAHNIDLAPRVASLRTGDTVSFYGEYEPNDRGGVIHWTHHDPQGRHQDGWLDHKGKRYQ